MSYLFLSIALSFWFYSENKRFTKQINLQTYRDFCSLYPLDLVENDFLKQSNLQFSKRYKFWLLLILCGLSSVLFIRQPITLLLIVLCLIHLSLLDYCYYLTDIKYVGAIFCLSLLHSLAYEHYFLQDKIMTLLVVMLFFSLFFYITKWLFNKEVFGLGDILLIIGLSPLFFLEQVLWLLLFSSVSGIIFSVIYFLFHKKKLERLAFIPFISLAYFQILLI